MRSLLPLALAVAVLRCAHAPEAPPAAPVATAPEWPEPQPPALRLPDSVRPTRYALDLKLLPAEPTFSGSVSIDVDVSEPVRQVWLHGQDMEVSQARIEAGGRTLEARPVTASEGRLGLLLPETLAPGKARIHIAFTGKVDRERSQGLYAVEEGGEPYLYTFFEPVDARRAFPCFDEPGFKVPWTLRITAKEDHVALANHPIVSREKLPDGLARVTFAESKPMPSYLVAFVVGPFDVVDAGTAGRNAAPLRFIVPRGRGAETAYAASVTPRIVTLIEDYFDMPYPYEKLDVAVVPRYWGTMEHPGLVALGQPLTLIRPGEETLARRKWYVNIANHELGHYWFGNIVTCQWWDDIWLNESLTSWLDRKTVDPFDTSWGFGLEQSTQSTLFALDTDALAATPPVRKPANTHDEVLGSFDNGTTYAKGSAIIDMFEAWLGEERMRDLLRGHIKKHEWGVATSEDFAATLSAAAGPDVARAFRSFIDQPGAPRIAAELQCQPGAPAKLTFTQERYVPAGSTASKDQTWSVPVCVRAGSGKTSERTCTMLTGATGELALPGKSCPSWFVLNAGGTGYYRSGYTREQLTRVLAAPTEALTVRERLTLLADMEAGVRRGDLPLGDVLRYVPTTAKADHRLIMQRGARLLTFVHVDRLSNDESARYRNWVAAMYGPRARALGWEPKPGDDDAVKSLRPNLLGLAALRGEDPALVRDANRLVKAWLADRKSVHPEAVPLALMVAARNGDKAFFDTLVARARATEDRTERSRVFTTLGSFRDPALMREALALVAGSEFDVRDTQSILTGAFSMPQTRALAWAFYQEHFDALASRMRSDEVAGLIGLVGMLCDEKTAAEAEAFLTPRAAKLENASLTLTRTMESIRLCAASSTLNAQSVRDFLKGQPIPAKSR
ncbi:peptidase, M1 (aminopeptidase N) family [Myxococcus xanthus DK 1622]|uniref:Aminopeptidase n=2 Tax=Myxococcus xanthus TaxID=34 RepID=Q1DD17_MYXXD|nr:MULTISPECIES: M1 family metallopeptidase [Myxococcus]ABF89934.1 peptidase, M1 (aminopeptidase N) family [Myxococcus xanthus DK 1622]NOJ53491.1 M1 family metallopeptidase [Myxococcus xanthus]QPM80841.1 M1 family metallopeptidase [Myxococcus xanthus]QVW69901.1 M1 family metallopeptidase [Myxococcus xanthus DZ2]QZZ48723.1 Aminopeptidase N [Myxococcus xanthus]